MWRQALRDLPARSQQTCPCRPTRLTGTDDAFHLNGAVNAGAYAYRLHKGDGGASTPQQRNSWFLRSSTLIKAPVNLPGPAPQPGAGALPGAVNAQPGPAPQPGAAPLPGAVNAQPAVLPSPVLIPGAAPTTPVNLVPYFAPATMTQAAPSAIPVQIVDQGYELPMYRAETPLYAAVPDLARTLPLVTAGSHHDRHGAGLQRADDKATFAGAWGRAFGGAMSEGASRSLTPSVNGAYAGIQIGADLAGYSTPFNEGRLGVFGGYATANTRIRGFAEGNINMAVGSLSVEAGSAGVYWTHTGPGGLYIDTTVTASRYETNGKSVNGLAPQVTGHGVTVSLEAGLPITLGNGLIVEPQVQAIYRTLTLNPASDAFSRISFNTHNGARLRLGGRLTWATTIGSVVVKPHLQAHMWRETGATDRTIYNGGTSIASASANRGADIDLGLEAMPATALTMWAATGATVEMDRPGARSSRRTWRGKVGLRYQW